jgi:hypothetical protein
VRRRPAQRGAGRFRPRNHLQSVTVVLALAGPGPVCSALARGDGVRATNRNHRAPATGTRSPRCPGPEPPAGGNKPVPREPTTAPPRPGSPRLPRRPGRRAPGSVGRHRATGGGHRLSARVARPARCPCPSQPTGRERPAVEPQRNGRRLRPGRRRERPACRAALNMYRKFSQIRASPP